MGVNLLAELDAPGEYYLDAKAMRLYFYPPEPPDADGACAGGAKAVLTYQPGAVVNVTSAVEGATLSDLVVRDGRHAGVVAVGARGLTAERLSVHSHGTHGIVLSDASDSAVRDSDVFDVGCSGIRATGGSAATLARGNVSVERSRVCIALTTGESMGTSAVGTWLKESRIDFHTSV